MRERPVVFLVGWERPLGRIREEGRAGGQAERGDLFLVSAAENPMILPFLSHAFFYAGCYEGDIQP